MRFNKKLFDEVQKWKKYMSSEEWADLRQKRLELDNFKCVLCKRNDENGLICHHLTYQNIFKEDIKDVISVCSKCHQRLHAFNNFIPLFVTRTGENSIFHTTQDEIKDKLLKRQ